MRFVFFCHSLRSDWNHGNAHFLRGVVSELQRRGHAVTTYEPRDGWSAAHLAADHGPGALDEFREAYPGLDVRTYAEDTLDLDLALEGAAVVVVHEWTTPSVVQAIGRARRAGGRFLLFFHDTHHRSASRPEDLAGIDLSDYDGVLAFGEVIRERYVQAGWGRTVWTWHEAADTTVFSPRPAPASRDDIIWIGNWGDDERTAELHAYLIEPVRALGLTGRVHGVRYPRDGQEAIARAGLTYGGRLANHRVPEAFAAHRVTVHVPRRPYVTALPGIPTIRMFEALACGIPLVSAPWADVEGLFDANLDYLSVRSTREMTQALRLLLHEPELAAAIAQHGRRTILRRHTCAHRVDELAAIIARSTGRKEVAAS